MDSEEIESKNLVEKYVLGRLSPEEEEAFEAYYLEHPDCLQDVKATACFAKSVRAYFDDQPSVQNPLVNNRASLSAWDKAEQYLAGFIPKPAIAFCCTLAFIPLLLMLTSSFHRPEKNLPEVSTGLALVDLGSVSRSVDFVKDIQVGSADTLVFKVILPIDMQKEDRFSLSFYEQSNTLVTQLDNVPVTFDRDRSIYYMAVSLPSSHLPKAQYRFEVSRFRDDQSGELVQDGQFSIE